MKVNDLAASIHPPSTIVTTEVQRIPNDGEHNGGAITASEQDEYRCNNTVTTTSTGLSTLSNDDHQSSSIYSSSGEEHVTAISRARQAIRDAIDYSGGNIHHPAATNKTQQQQYDNAISPEQAAFALIRARQQLRNQNQQHRTPPPSTTTIDHSINGLTHLPNMDGHIFKAIISPTFVVKEQQLASTAYSVLMPHHIDTNTDTRQQHFQTNDDDDLAKQDTSAIGTNEKIITLDIVESFNSSASTAATPDTSRSSSPSRSIDNEDEHDISDMEIGVGGLTDTISIEADTAVVTSIAIVTNDIDDDIRNNDKIDHDAVGNGLKEDQSTEKSVDVECDSGNIRGIDPESQRKNTSTETENVVTQNQSTQADYNDDANAPNDANASNDFDCGSNSSFDMTELGAISPIVIQKVTAYIDRFTLSNPQPEADTKILNETKVNVDSNGEKEICEAIRIVGDTSFSTSQSLDVNIDPTMMNFVTSSVRDYIDSMHENSKTKTLKCPGGDTTSAENIAVQTEVTKPIEIDARPRNPEAVKDKSLVQTVEVTKSLEVDTQPAVVEHIDDLIEYLSGKASTKNETKLGIDPPSFDVESQQSNSVDEVKSDPPLNLTESEVARSSVVDPEVNPLKILTFDTDGHDDDTDNVTLTDPEVAKSEIMHDDIGEPSIKSIASQIHDNICTIDVGNSITVDDTNSIFCSSHVHSERVVLDTPRRKTIVLTIPSLNVVESADEILTKDTFEPDGLYPSSEARDFASTIHNLHYLLTGNSEISDIDVQQFGKLVRFSSAFIDSGLNVTTYGASQIMTRANELQVTLVVTNRYIDAIRSMGDDSRRTFIDLEDLHILVQFLRDLNIYLEILTSSTLSNFAADAIGSSSPTILDVQADTFEVEVNDGYVSKEFGPADDEEPWWEVVDRLNGTGCQKPLTYQRSDILNTGNDEATEPQKENDANVRQESSRGKIEKESENCVERDIARFWNDREQSICQREILDVPPVGAFVVKKAHSYSGHDIPTNHRKSKRITKTRSQSSTASNISQRSLKSMQRKWARQQSMATTTEQQPKLNAVSATSAFFDKENKLRVFNLISNLWRQSYADRTEHHQGYFNVDKYSLYATSAVRTYRHPLDCVAWESRSVHQRFMYEQSISFTRNWFGCLTETNANPVIKEPVCRPKSMEMPMEADEWTEEWFLNRHRQYYRGDNDDDDDDDLWDDEPPECGKIRNVRLRPGEKITRVTPDLTSHLRRSRWRRKHFPSGTFPYV